MAQSQNDDPEWVDPADSGGGFDPTCCAARTGLDPHIDAPIRVTVMPGGIDPPG